MRFAGGSLVVETVVVVVAIVAIVAGVSAILADRSCCERCCNGENSCLSMARRWWMRKSSVKAVALCELRN
jgi:hypothetical protein